MRWLVAFIVLIAVFPVFAEETSSSIEIGVTDASYPVGYRLASGEMAGSLVRVLALLSQASGIQLEVRGYPWARVQTMVKGGELAAFCGVETAERDGFALFSKNALLITPPGIYTRADDHRFDSVQTLDDLKPFRHGSYLGNGWVKQHFDENQVIWARTYQDVLKMIDGRRVDFMFGDAYSLPQRLTEQGLEGKIVFHTLKIADSIDYRLAVRRDLPNAPEILARLDKAILQIRKDPAFAEAAAPYK